MMESVMFDYTKEPGRQLTEKRYNKKALPLVSIVTAYYNAEKYFEQTYHCVINQTFPWYEWIIVNDGSTESTEKLEQLASSDERITVYNIENAGPASARNYGIKKSNSEIIIPLDADDLIEETFVEALYFGLYFNPESSWSYMDSVGFGEETYIWKKPFDSQKMKRENLLVNVGAIRKADLEEIGYYDEIGKYYHEDWGLWLKLLAKGKVPVHLSGLGFWYRRTATGAKNETDKNATNKKKSDEIIKKLASDIKAEVKAIEFPYSGKMNGFRRPEKMPWSLKTYEKKDKTNVLMLLPWLVMGGADLFNLEVVKKADKSKYDFSIITTEYHENPWKQRFQEYVGAIFELPNFLDVSDYASFISYVIQSREIDILFLSNSYYGYYIVPWLRKEFPELAIIDYVHMEEWYWRNGGYARTAGALGDVIEKTYVCNGKTQKILEDHFKRAKGSVETLYIGVDKEKFSADKVTDSELREKYHIDKQSVILFPCRIHPQKRPFLMLEIVKKLKDVLVLVVGDGPQLEEMKQKTQEMSLDKKIKYVGRVDEMRPYYKVSDVTLICSLKEGLALTAYESLSMGVPVVSSDVGGQSELINDSVGKIIPLEQDEETSLDNRNFKKSEIDKYVTAIEAILNKSEADRDKLKSACRERIEEGFSTDKMIIHLERAFEETKQADRVEERKRKARQKRPRVHQVKQKKNYKKYIV